MPDENEQSGQQPSGEEQKRAPKPEDFDKLKSSLDKQIADLRKELGDRDAQLAKTEEERRQGLILADVEKELGQIDLEGPDAAKQLKVITLRLADSLARTETSRQRSDALAKDQAAAAMAWELVNEHGGDYTSLKSELLKANSWDSMTTTKERLALKLERESPAKPSGEAKTSVDGGAGRAVTSNVLEEMRNIDTTTPEGQTEWLKRQGEIKKKIDALAR